MLGIETLIVQEVENAAEWREQKAEQYPEDAVRNLEAAEKLRRIVAYLWTLEGSKLHWSLQAVCTKDCGRYCSALSALVQAVGFRWSIETGPQFLGMLFALAEASDGDVVAGLQD